jgi:hypothetical protein
MSKTYYVNQYLSELDIKFLPGGMLVKSDTGMGATHFELVSPRNSIIVEPIRVTASSKVQSARSDDNYLQDRLPLYVGSAVGNMPGSTDLDYIKDYLENDSVTYKKFICVADSLYRIMDAISFSDRFKVKEYFLLIDEIDSIQMDSSFRRKIEGCLDYYSAQPENMRAMLTATPLQFSHPLLKDEPVTKFQLKSSVPRPTTLVNTSFWWQFILDHVMKLYSSSNNKIVVVINRIQFIKLLINQLVKSGLDSSDIAVLCSTANRSEFPDHFCELKETKFPERINFITSAYYSGYDIREDFHLVCYASFLSDSTMLSPAQIKQIYGRCRKPFSILSHYIVFRPRLRDRPQKPPKKTIKDREIPFVSEQGLLHEAKAVVNAEKCFNLNYPHNQVGGLDILKNFRAILVDALNDKKLNSVRQNEDQTKLVISYFFIDSKVENYRVYKEFYALDADPVARLTEVGMQVDRQEFYSDLKLEPGELASLDAKNSKLVNKLQSLIDLTEIEISEELDKMGKSNYPTANHRILSFMNQLKHYFPLEEVLGEAIHTLTTDGVPKRDNRAFKNWLVKKHFQTSDKDTPIRIFVEHFFKVGDKLTSEDVAKKMKDCIVHAQLKTLVGYTSSALISTMGKQGKELVTLAGNFVELKRHRKQNGGSVFSVIRIYPPIAKRPIQDVGMTVDELFFSKGEKKTAFG